MLRGAKTMKTVIFDMYGVIIKDPDGGLVPFVNRTFPELTPDDVYTRAQWIEASIGGLSSLDFFKNLGYQGGLSKIEKKFLDTIEIDDTFYDTARVLSNYYRLALLSNDLSEWSGYLRDKFQINHFFDAIIVSGDVKMRKPDTRIFQLALEKLAQPAQDCVYVDDRRKNLAAAQSLGMDTILFNSRNVQYDGKSVNSFHELLDRLIYSNQNKAI